MSLPFLKRSIAASCALAALIALAGTAKADVVSPSRTASVTGRDTPTALRLRTDSVAVLQVIEQYSAALAAGDSVRALSLLTPDAVVLESGGMETREEYRSHHLPADIAFSSGVPTQRTVRRVQVKGDMAWVASTSTSEGEFRGRAVNSIGAELMVLVRTPDGWRISAIHWSSRARR
jgi:uncharacterized protein (TIGR02246 family)